MSANLGWKERSSPGLLEPERSSDLCRLTQQDEMKMGVHYSNYWRVTYQTTLTPISHTNAVCLFEKTVVFCFIQTDNGITMDTGGNRDVSAIVPETMEQLSHKIEEKVRIGQARVVRWEDIKETPPEKIKVSPMAMIPHKSRLARAILDLLLIPTVE